MSIRHPAFVALVGRMDDANYSMSDEHYRLRFAYADIPRDATEDTLHGDTVEAVERLTCWNIPATPGHAARALLAVAYCEGWDREWAEEAEPDRWH